MEGQRGGFKLGQFGRLFEIKTRERPEEVRARLKREEDDAAHQRRKDFALFVIVSVMVCIVACACLWLVLKPATSAELQRTAFSLLTVIVSASMGYLTGKGSR